MSLSLNKSFALPTASKKVLLLKVISINFFLCLFLNSANAGILEKSVNLETKFQSQDLYQALAAEMFNKFGEDNLAVDYYYKLSATNNDPAIAKRVTELATVTGQIAKALDGAKRWVELKPSNLEANQYLALLQLRNSHFELAAKQLDSIRVLIEETSDVKKPSEADLNSKTHKFYSSESLTFIGAMLAAEAHHLKAFNVFNLYIDEHASKIKNYTIYNKQQRLIAAQLAMKAKKYSFVISALEGLENLDAKNHVDAIVMQAKALHKLHQNSEAIKRLRLIQDHPEANDSHRLELVRLLVLEKQKDSALPLLEALVSKHSKNFELLKSLIALQIDQSNLSKVESNISKLRANNKYRNEADYFAGEFAEKLGQREKALLSYEKVVEGSYLKNAHKKRISLTKLIYDRAALNTLLYNEQNNAK